MAQSHAPTYSPLSESGQCRPLVLPNLIDSRGHGRSTLGPYPLSYELMQTDVLAVTDTLQLRKASFVGWSDGAIISLVMAMKHPDRVNTVYAFGANMNADGIVRGGFDSPHSH